jgi:hypothetical protein
MQAKIRRAAGAIRPVPQDGRAVATERCIVTIEFLHPTKRSSSRARGRRGVAGRSSGNACLPRWPRIGRRDQTRCDRLSGATECAHTDFANGVFLGSRSHPPLRRLGAGRACRNPITQLLNVLRRLRQERDHRRLSRMCRSEHGYLDRVHAKTPPGSLSDGVGGGAVALF